MVRINLTEIPPSIRNTEYKVSEYNISDILSSILKREGISQSNFSERLGYKSRQAVNNKLTRYRMIQIDKLIKFLDELDYELIIRVKESLF